MGCGTSTQKGAADESSPPPPPVPDAGPAPSDASVLGAVCKEDDIPAPDSIAAVPAPSEELKNDAAVQEEGTDANLVTAVKFCADGDDDEDREGEEEDQSRAGPYSIGKKLGAGAYAEVFLGTVDGGDQYAIKVYNKRKMRKKRMGWGKPTMLQMVAGEIAIMKKLDHPNIVKLHDVIDDDDGDRLLVVMELMAFGTTAVEDAKVEFHDEPMARRFMVGSVFAADDSGPLGSGRYSHL